MGLGEIAQSAVVGAVSGAVAGLAGPEAGPLAKMAVGALSSGARQMASNAMSGKPLMDGVGQAALIGGVTGGAMEGGGALLKGAGTFLKGGIEDAEEGISEGEGALSEADSEGSCALSFVPTTPVATNHGEQAIGTLEVGEQVWAYNPQTKKMELEPIQHIWLNHDNDLVDLTLTATVKSSDGKTTQKDEVIHTNEKHPFLTEEKGFIPVSQIQPGMHVRQADGGYGVVATLVVVPRAMWMYNLTVANDHTYTVGYEQWIVHNRGVDPDSTDWDWIQNLPADPQELIDAGWQDITHPTARLNSNSLRLFNPATGDRVRFDQGTPGADGWVGRDHYHVYNPDSTGKGDLYLDSNGNPVPRGSKPSHIAPNSCS